MSAEIGRLRELVAELELKLEQTEQDNVCLANERDEVLEALEQMAEYHARQGCIDTLLEMARAAIAKVKTR